MELPTAPPSGGFLATATAAMTLREDVYRSYGSGPEPLRRGLIFVVGVSVAVALASILGAALTEWTSPDMAAIEDAVVEGVFEMPWTQDVPPDALDEVEASMRQIYDTIFGVVSAVQPSVTSAIVMVFARPVGAVLGWLLIGVVAHAAARLLHGTATLGATLGATSLAVAPQLLGVVHALPYVQTLGLGIWSVVCGYLAIKTVHGLSPGRAFWATLAPLAVMALAAAILGASVAATVALAFTQMGAQ